MRTPNDIMHTPGAEFGYHGDHPDWPIVYAIHRDSGVLERANYAAILSRLGRDCDPDNWTEERFGHYLVGWTDNIMVAPDSDAALLGQEIRDKLEDYPVVDEGIWSELEQEEAVKTTVDAVRSSRLTGKGDDYDSIAGYVLEWCDQDGNSREHYSYRGIDDWYPSDRAVWYGYLHYRRALRRGEMQQTETA